MRGSKLPLKPEPPPTSRIGIDCLVLPSTRRGTCGSAASASPGASIGESSADADAAPPRTKRRRRLTSRSSFIFFVLLRANGVKHDRAACRRQGGKTRAGPPISSSPTPTPMFHCQAPGPPELCAPASANVTAKLGRERVDADVSDIQRQRIVGVPEERGLSGQARRVGNQRGQRLARVRGLEIQLVSAPECNGLDAACGRERVAAAELATLDHEPLRSELDVRKAWHALANEVDGS